MGNDPKNKKKTQIQLFDYFSITVFFFIFFYDDTMVFLQKPSEFLLF